MDPSPSTTQPTHQLQPQHHQVPATVSTSPPQIRSRITVVCAECKRLKLKCDRRNPCGSCTKRDTVARCIYSPAAAEKVDLHSLNNRLIQVETTLAQLTAALPPGFLLPPQHSSQPPGFGPASNSISPITPNCIIAALGEKVAMTGSVLSIAPDEVTAWLNRLDIDRSLCPSFHPTSSPSSSTNPSSDSANLVKAEPTTIYLPPTTHPFKQGSADDPTLTHILPPLSAYHHSQPSRSSPTIPSTNLHSLPPHPSPPGLTITAKLLSYLPVQPYRTLLLDHVQHFLLLRPSFDWPEFRCRIEHLLSTFDNTAFDPIGTLNPSLSANQTKAQTARDIFNTSSSRSSSRSSRAVNTLSRSHSTTPTPPSIVSFFGATAAAFALGALLASKHEQQDNDVDAMHLFSPASTTPGSLCDIDDRMAIDEGLAPSPSQVRRLSQRGISRSKRLSPAYLHALSVQALSVHEAGAAYDIDYIIACFLQVMFLLQGGNAEERLDGHQVSASMKGGEDGMLFPLVAKIVNIARQIGLSVDPDDAPGRYNAKESEMRRLVWWQVFYYDLFVSDCMIHPPLITDGSFTTRTVDVDEGAVAPAGSKHFELTCRFAQLVRSAKRLVESGPGYGIDQAAAVEHDVRTWLDGLPEEWKLGGDLDAPPSWPIDDGRKNESELVRMAQRCELTIGAYRLVMKMYAPFLRVGMSSSTSPVTPASAQNPTVSSLSMQMPSHQAVHGSVNAAHAIIQASRLLWAACRPSSSSSSCSESKLRAVFAPSLFDFCSFERGLVDAAVVCALAAVRQQGTVWANVALEDLCVAQEVLELEGLDRFGQGGPWNGGLRAGEALKIVDALRKKVEVARGAPVNSSGIKRKHSRSRSLEEPCTARRPPNTSSTGTVETPVEQTRDRNEAPSAGIVRDREKEREERQREKEKKEKEKKLGKKGPYPTFGIRIRPGREMSPLLRQRTGSGSTSTSSSSEGAVQVQAQTLPPPLQHPLQPSSPLIPPTSSMTLSVMTVPRTPVMIKSPPSGSTEMTFQQQQSPMQMTTPAVNTRTGESDYPMSFTANEDRLQRRRYSQQDLGTGTTTHHLSQPHTPIYQEYPNNSSYLPPLGSFDNDGSAARASSSMSSNYGTCPHAHTQLPSPQHFTSRGHGHHEGTPLFGASFPDTAAGDSGPGGPPSTSVQGLYMQNGYAGQFNGLSSGLEELGSLTTSVPTTTSFDKTHMPTYGVKPPDRIREGSSMHQQSSQYQIDGGHDPTTHDHGLPISPPQSWSQATGAAFWGGQYYS